jgi:uncharacterized protein (DUF2132 family)
MEKSERQERTADHPNDPFHGVTLEMMLNRLVERLGWEEMGRLINIRCFRFNPSIKSSLQFLRRTPWARKQVEDLYLARVVPRPSPKP